MIKLLPNWLLTGQRPAFYDTESVTVIELAANLQGKMNELINDYNAFVNTINATILDFMGQSKADQEAFEVAMRQEFQDFIDVIDMKVAGMAEAVTAQNEAQVAEVLAGEY